MPTPPRTTRVLLSREQVLRAALALVDEQGLDGLSMHRLGARLDVKAMSLYNHVEDKDDVLNGIVGLLWAEVERDQVASNGWREGIQSLAGSLRAAVHRHPRAAPLLTSRPVLPIPALLVFQRHLGALRAAGLSPDGSAEMLRALVAFAFGYGLAEVAWATAASSDETALRRLRRVNQLLPPDVPDDLLEVALAMCDGCDMGASFELVVELLVGGLESSGRSA